MSVNFLYMYFILIILIYKIYIFLAIDVSSPVSPAQLPSSAQFLSLLAGNEVGRKPRSSSRRSKLRIQCYSRPTGTGNVDGGPSYVPLDYRQVKTYTNFLLTHSLLVVPCSTT